ncbi:MAG: hypothetical protein LBU53_07480 [Zoogloeaceae bacterium]|jgi:hypothetical protein|nr:hypothetical protein [Zoogloeaceae bacterium]
MIEALLIRFGAGKVALFAGIALTVFAFGAGWTINGWRLQSQLAAWESEAAKTVNAALLAAREVEARGEILAGRQLALEAENLKLGKERDDALRKTTTGRACFNGATVRLLDDRRQGTGIRDQLPAPARFAAGALAAAPLDSGDLEDGYESSDTDVALWASYAIDRYDTCRGRIDALRLFYEEQGNE